MNSNNHIITPTKTNRLLWKEGTDRILIATLGANSYFNTTYIDRNKQDLVTSGYAFDAVIKQENPNKLILVGTRRSWWNKVIEFYSQMPGLEDQDEVNKIMELWSKKQGKYDWTQKTHASGPAIYYDESVRGGIDTVDSNGMTEDGWQRIENFIAKAGGFDKVHIAIVPNGITEKEQKEYFDRIREGIVDMTKAEENKIEILFDISNGFRSIPLYNMMLVRYFSLLRPQKFSFKAYYGNFDIKKEYGGKSPLVNLSVVPLMTDWINALHDFLEYGSVKTLIRCLETEKNNQKGKNKEENIANITSVIKEFERFEYAMNANNLYYLIRGISFITGNQYSLSEKVNNKTLDINHECFSPQARLMLENIQKRYKDRFDMPSTITTEAYILEQIASLYAEQGNYGDAAIAFQEGVLTYVMERFYRPKDIDGELVHNFYEKFVHVTAERERVKRPYIDMIDKNEEDWEKNKLNSNTVKFAKHYKLIKERIRNVQAHFKYDELEEVSEEEMKKLLDGAIEAIIREMKSECDEKERISDDMTGLQSIYSAALRGEGDRLGKLIKQIAGDNGKYKMKDEEELIKLEKDDKTVSPVLAEFGIRMDAMLSWLSELLKYSDDNQQIVEVYHQYAAQNQSSDELFTDVELCLKMTYFAWLEKKLNRKNLSVSIENVNKATVEMYLDQLTCNGDEKALKALARELRTYSQSIYKST